MSDHDEFLDEFIDECDENLDVLVQELVALDEASPCPERLQSARRMFHTIKGSSGFLSLIKISVLALDGESVLNRVGEGKLRLDSKVSELLLKIVDSIRGLLDQLRETGSEGCVDHSPLRGQVHELLSSAEES